MAVVYLFWFTIAQVVLQLSTCPSTVRGPTIVSNFTHVSVSVSEHSISLLLNYRPSGELCTFNSITLAVMSGPPFRLTCSPHLSRRRFVILVLLVMSGIETNPGPRQDSFRLGVLNASGATRKAAGLAYLIADHHLCALAINETWIRDGTRRNQVRFDADRFYH